MRNGDGENGCGIRYGGVCGNDGVCPDGDDIGVNLKNKTTAPATVHTTTIVIKDLEKKIVAETVTAPKATAAVSNGQYDVIEDDNDVDDGDSEDSGGGGRNDSVGRNDGGDDDGDDDDSGDGDDSGDFSDGSGGWDDDDG